MPLRNERRLRTRKATTADVAKVALAQAESAETAAAAAQTAADAAIWQLIGVTEVTTGVATVEQTFDADTYSQILVVFSDISSSSSSPGITLAATLRYSGGAIVTLTSTVDVLGGSATTTTSGAATFTLGRGAGTKRSIGAMDLYNHTAGMERRTGHGANATSPDRVRLALSTGNIDGNTAAHVYVYGLKIA